MRDMSAQMYEGFCRRPALLAMMSCARAANASITLALLQSRSGRTSAGTPGYTHRIEQPAIPVSTNAVNIWDGPIHAPIAAQSFTSPIPIPSIQHTIPKNSAPTPMPARLCSVPCHPASHPRRPSPTRQKREHQPIRNTVAVQIGYGRHSKDDQCWPSGDGVHTKPFLRRLTLTDEHFPDQRSVTPRGTWIQRIPMLYASAGVHDCLPRARRSEAEGTRRAFGAALARSRRLSHRKSVAGRRHQPHPSTLRAKTGQF